MKARRVDPKEEFVNKLRAAQQATDDRDMALLLGQAADEIERMRQAVRHYVCEDAIRDPSPRQRHP
jgi:hypothetical protein